MTRSQIGFSALIAVQAAHSTEEYVGKLYDVFSPAKFLSSLVSDDLKFSFGLLNILLVALGLWCFIWPVSRQWRSARLVCWIWVVVELINGTVHTLWSIRQRAYTPGLATAPFLFCAGLYLASQ